MNSKVFMSDDPTEVANNLIESLRDGWALVTVYSFRLQRTNFVILDWEKGRPE